MSRYRANLFVPGRPEEKGNHRANIVPIPGAYSETNYRKKYRAYIFDTNDQKLKKWQQMIKIAALGQRPPEILTGPISLDVVFVFARPKTVKRKCHTVAPDRDKLLRAVQDALEGVIYKNDSQVIAGDTSKIYGDNQGAFIKIREVEKANDQMFFYSCTDEK